MSRKLVVICMALFGIVALAPAQMINEFLYDTQGTDDPTIMFVEIWGPASTNLTGWSLVGINGNGGSEYLTVPLSGTIPADGYFVVGGSAVQNVDQIVTADFQNAGSSTGEDCDGIDLRNSSGQTVDHLCYGTCAAGHVCTGEGGSNAPDPFPSGGINYALARIPDHQDTDNNGTDFTVTETLTPGQANSGVPCDPVNAWLADIRENDDQGVSVLNGQFVITRGIVNVDNYVLDSLTFSNFYFQDGDAGVNVFRGGVPAGIVAGDCVVVSGWVSQYNGLTEIVSSGSGNCIFEVEVTNHVNPPTPLPLTCNSFFEAFEGMLGQINNVTIVGGTWPAQGENGNLDITDGTGTITMRIVNDTNIDGSPQPQGAFNVVGIITQFDSDPPYDTGYQITPRSLSDLIPLSADDPSNPVTVTDFRLLGSYPNPFNSTAQIRFEVGSARDLTLRIFDLTGREVTTESFSGLNPGSHAYTWNPIGATGLYFIRMENGARVETAKALYLK